VSTFTPAATNAYVNTNQNGGPQPAVTVAVTPIVSPPETPPKTASARKPRTTRDRPRVTTTRVRAIHTKLVAALQASDAAHTALGELVAGTETSDSNILGSLQRAYELLSAEDTRVLNACNQVAAALNDLEQL
jgi:hypothetical protein